MNARIEIKENEIHIDNLAGNIGLEAEVQCVIALDKPIPELVIYETGKLIRTFLIETLDNNPNLTGQYLHCSVRVFSNSGVMIDGIISNSGSTYSDWTQSDYEAIRLQPFFLSDQNQNNLSLFGGGLFARGLHFEGTITPMGVRNICVCDSCNKSFTIQHLHGGFSNLQYFYSSDGLETLVVPYGAIVDLPTQGGGPKDAAGLVQMENKLPKPSNDMGSFNYYNPFRCPHCSAAYIDFESHKEIRPGEYYGNTYINKPTKQFVS
ncbi:MAG: hypothetical protein ACI95C_002261 [Pseudohongiellaceae bacterium]|jgi:hypothetical protein